MLIFILIGERPPLPEDLNLGEVAEDSINRDPVGFVKDLKKRAAGTASAFMEVEADDLTTISFEGNHDLLVFIILFGPSSHHLSSLSSHERGRSKNYTHHK